jgi:hypothetical protein
MTHLREEAKRKTLMDSLQHKASVEGDILLGFSQVESGQYEQESQLERY